jgi:small multidrug resistance family-3 protein
VRNHRLFLTLALAEKGASVFLLVPAGIALALFVWLLTLHPAASGRVYAAYGGVYVCTALLWLRVVDGVKLSLYDWAGALVALCGMLIIVAGWGRT